MSFENFSGLQKERIAYKPKFSDLFSNYNQLYFEKGEKSSSLDGSEEIKNFFPISFGKEILELKKGREQNHSVKKIGVLFSGGQAAGGHNVIWGIFEGLAKLNSQSELIGFLQGPSGILEGKYIKITKQMLERYKNQGGFDLIGSGRTKIETDEQLKAALLTCQKLKLDGLIIIGGDDSNTNAAVLAEYFLKEKALTSVVGVPKTIDGDLRNEYVEITFGFDTACKTYSEMIGNIEKDALSAKKYYHFIKLMGRSASHIALECAMSTFPNFALIGEEVEKEKKTINDITCKIADLICKRADAGKSYGVILIPEGTVEFIPEMKTLISELNRLFAENQLPPSDIEQFLQKKLTPPAFNCFSFLPPEIARQLLLDRDPHGNVQVSKIETEKLFMETVAGELKKREAKGAYKGKFNSVAHFFGYEGRSGMPSNFDADYCFSLGLLAALLTEGGHTGYMAGIQHLKEGVTHWKFKGVPITMLMNMEKRKGKFKPVIKKALVDLSGPHFKEFASLRTSWEINDLYKIPGPIQFFGPQHLTDSLPYCI